MTKFEGSGRRFRPALPLVGVAFLLVATPLAAGAQSGGAATGTFHGTASSDLIRVVARPEPAILLDPVLDPGVTMAQAAADSLGTSTAYAKSVFPGTLYALLPGLGSLTGAAVPVPPNPLEVASAYPSTPRTEQTLGTISLRATSDEAASSGSVTNGTDRATASVAADAVLGDVISTAEAAVSAIRIGDQLVLHGVHVSARAARDSAGELERSSSLEVAAISVAGQRVALSPGTLELLGTPTELPLVSPIRTLVSSLTDAGIGIEYVPAIDLDDGVQSAALRINLRMQPPQDAGFSGVEYLRVVVSIGGALATAGSGGIDISVDAVPSVPSVGDLGTVAVAPSSASAGSVRPPSGQTGAVAAPATAPALEPALTSSVVPGIRSSLAAFYPVLVLAAALVYGLARSSSRLGGDRR